MEGGGGGAGDYAGLKGMRMRNLGKSQNLGRGVRLVSLSISVQWNLDITKLYITKSSV